MLLRTRSTSSASPCVTKTEKVFHKTLRERRHLVDDPGVHAVQLVLATWALIQIWYSWSTVYRNRRFTNDVQRVSFTRLRVSGHNLAIETGRWDRRGRGRLPPEERLCACGEVCTNWAPCGRVMSPNPIHSWPSWI